MPYLQLDLTGTYPVEIKRRLATTMSATYAEMMQVDVRRISIAVRELGEGGLWRVLQAGSDPVEVSVLMCDIRRGRTPELRMALAKVLCRQCCEILGLEEDRLNVEFTQHTGDEMYHPSLGGYSPEWMEGER